MTRMPPWADTCMMPRPIEPVPTTPTATSAALGSKGIAVLPGAARFGARLTLETRPCHGRAASARPPPQGPPRMMTVEEAITGRQSIRAFLPKPVPRELIERILKIAGRAPSGSNIQPWKVWVLDGTVKEELSRALKAEKDAGIEGDW